jgi:hypothetical protein
VDPEPPRRSSRGSPRRLLARRLRWRRRAPKPTGEDGREFGNVDAARVEWPGEWLRTRGPLKEGPAAAPPKNATVPGLSRHWSSCHCASASRSSERERDWLVLPGDASLFAPPSSLLLLLLSSSSLASSSPPSTPPERPPLLRAPTLTLNASSSRRSARQSSEFRRLLPGSALPCALPCAVALLLALALEALDAAWRREERDAGVPRRPFADFTAPNPPPARDVVQVEGRPSWVEWF